MSNVLFYVFMLITCHFACANINLVYINENSFNFLFRIIKRFIMISNIILANGPFDKTRAEINGLKEINYFFGANGSGKTSISRVITTPEAYPESQVTWQHNRPLEVRTFNRDFIDENYSSAIKGVFTLGKRNTNAVNKIEELEKENEELRKQADNYKFTLEGLNGDGGKRGELNALIDEYRDKFWKLKSGYGNRLKDGLQGPLNSKEQFMKKLLQEYNNSDNFELLSVDELILKNEAVFSKESEKLPTLPLLDFEKILEFENEKLLIKKVFGKQDLEIAKMIRKLENSDWVRQGVKYLEQSEGYCPFCQQKNQADLVSLFEDYFDEEFIKDTERINTITKKYIDESTALLNQIKSIIEQEPRYLDLKNLSLYYEQLESSFSNNIQKLENKKKEPSLPVELVPLKQIATELLELISAANTEIGKYNQSIDSSKKDKDVLRSQNWRFVVNEGKTDIQLYLGKKEFIDRAIDSLVEKLDQHKENIQNNERAIKNLEGESTSVQPTMHAINDLLNRFGFKKFKLDLGENKLTYKLVRPNGEDARQTLSDGEKNFVSFLYFYNLINGSQTTSGITKNKIVIFDDPVSSLDSNVLFIVRSLIKGIIENIKDNKGNVKQILILTHNTYFHKEVSFEPKRRNGLLRDETFWIVRSDGINSYVNGCSSNPIKSSYETLWDEINNTNRNYATLRNSTRRILESYFNLVACLKPNELYEKFKGGDLVICKSLLAWLNAGSHIIWDEDLCVPMDDSTVDLYLDVFRKIFIYSNHEEHYKLMMGIE